MIEVDVIQGSDEWLKMRLGKITGSRSKDMFKSDHLTLVDEMIAEIDSELIEPSFINAKMQRGKDLEPIVRQLYQEVRLVIIEEVGFCISTDNDYLALSPDGFTPERTGAIEIKCPDTKTHVKYIRMGKIPNEYKYQIIWYFLVNKKLEWLDFISFDDRFKSRPMWIKRVTRAELHQEIELSEYELNKFILKFEMYYKKVLGA